jgi:hypothetical protein
MCNKPKGRISLEKIILNNIEDNVFRLFYGGLNISDFENWVYESLELEALLSPDDYLELISLNYQSKFVLNQIEEIISKYIDYGKFETAKLIDQLSRAREKDEDTGEILRSFYNMYCNGYYFLQDIGLGYGLACEVPLNSGANSWEELDEKGKNELVNSFYPQIIGHIEKVLEWIEDKKIILTGKKNNLDRWEFIDYRNSEEQKSSIIVEPKSQVEKKKWWEFWK